MSENTFPIYKVDAIVLFFRTEVLTAQEAKHFTKADLLPSPKVPITPNPSAKVLYPLKTLSQGTLTPESLRFI